MNIRFWQPGAIALGLTLSLISCGGDEAEETATDSPDAAETEEVTAETEAETPTATLEPAPEDTFAGKVQTTLKTDFENQTGIPLESVACPGEIEPSPGQAFDCEVSLADGNLLRVTVAQEGEGGEQLSWSAPGFLSMRSLEESIQATIQEQLQKDVVADCGGGEYKYRLASIGETFDCTTADDAGADAGTIKVTVENEKGSVNWELQP